LFNRAGDSERPMDGRQGIRDPRDSLRQHESRLPLDRGDQLRIAIGSFTRNPSGTPREVSSGQFLIAKCN
jgi:hypothetical protein